MKYVKFLQHTSSVMMLFTVVFTTYMNIYYWVHSSNIVTNKIDDIYGENNEVLFAVNDTYGLDVQLVLDYVNGKDSFDEFVKRVEDSPKRSFDSKIDQCASSDIYNPHQFFAFCWNITDIFPLWAQSFEAIVLQEVHLSTIEEFRNKKNAAYIVVMEGYVNSRKEYYNSEGITNQVCTVEGFSRSVGNHSTPRYMYTSEHGLLRSINCNTLDKNSDGCESTRLSDAHEIVPGAQVHQYQVYEDESGAEIISLPWTRDALLGYQTQQSTRRKVDGCVFLRGDNQLGWFGIQYMVYKVKVPQTAPLGKLQLAVIIGLIWGIDEGWSVVHIFEPVIKASRLGVFFMVVLQLTIAVQSEIDIFRTIVSWELDTVENYLLFLYIVLTIGFVVSMTSIVCLRAYGGPWICHVGNLLGLLLSPIAIVFACMIGFMRYSSYTVENGMKAQDSYGCPKGFYVCSSQDSFNYIYLTYIIALLPVAVDYAVYRFEKRNPDHIKKGIHFRKEKIEVEKQLAELTSFEKHCLHKEFCQAIIPDLVNPYIYRTPVRGDGKKITLVSYDVIHAASYSIIHGRFLCRTRDLYMLGVLKCLPRVFSQNQSTVVWPLRVDEVAVEYSDVGTERLFSVGPPMRVYTKDLHMIRTTDAKSILSGQKIPLR